MCSRVTSTRGDVAAEVPRRSRQLPYEPERGQLQARVLKRRVADGFAARSAKQPGLRCLLPRRARPVPDTCGHEAVPVSDGRARARMRVSACASRRTRLSPKQGARPAGIHSNRRGDGVAFALKRAPCPGPLRAYSGRAATALADRRASAASARGRDGAQHSLRTRRRLRECRPPRSEGPQSPRPPAGCLARASTRLGTTPVLCPNTTKSGGIGHDPRRRESAYLQAESGLTPRPHPASHARGRWFEPSRAHERPANSRFLVSGLREAILLFWGAPKESPE
jgi:hypothetical protein